MAVAFDASSESDAGTTGHPSVASFSWTHTPVGTPRGVGVMVFTNTGAEYASSVTYGGVTVPFVPGAAAVDSAGETAYTSLWFRGDSLPTGAQTVVVTRINSDATVIYAIAFTVTAGTDTWVPSGSIRLLEGDQILAEQSSNDGIAGPNSTRFAGAGWGGNPAPTVGANSTQMLGIGYTLRTVRGVRETTAGSGARNIGFDTSVGSLSDDAAVIHFAVSEVTTPRKHAHYQRMRA